MAPKTSKPILLMLGGAVGDIPQIQAAQRLGYHVITVGSKPSDLGHKFSDQYINADYSNADEMLILARQLRVHAVVPGCNDFAAVSASQVTHSLDLYPFDSPDIAALIHSKDRLRGHCQAIGIRVPQHFSVNNIDDLHDIAGRLPYPVIVKPVDLTGGKGIYIAATPEELLRHAHTALEHSKLTRLVVEQFIEGSNHGLTAIIVDRRVVFCFMDEEQYFLNPFLVSGASTHSQFDLKVITEVTQDIEKLAVSLSLPDGMVHTQIIVDGQSNAYLIEVCRRPPGDLYTKFVSLATGYDYPTAILQGYLGNDIILNKLKTEDTQPLLARHCRMASKNGRLKNISISDVIADKIIDFLPLMEVGDGITNFMAQKMGIAFIAFSSLEDYKTILPKLIEHIVVELEP